MKLFSRTKHILILMVIVLAFAFVPIVGAVGFAEELPPPFPFPTDPVDFLSWLSGPMSAGVIVSLLFERALWFQKLTSKEKHRLVLATFLLLPVVSVAGQWALGSAVALPAGEGTLLYQAWAKYVLTLLMQGLTAWGVSQYAHKFDPQKE